MNPAPANASTEPADSQGLNRRNFLVTMAGGLSIGFFLPSGGRTLGALPTQDVQINAWIKIGTDGRVVLLFGGSEMGQGSMSGLCQILAEELKVAWNQIAIQQSDANPAISYTTGGSSAVSRRYTPLRTAGATARELLVASAMIANGDTNRANYTAAAGKVTYTNPLSGATTSWAYGDLAVGATAPAASSLLPNPIPLTDPASFSLIGQPLPRADIPLKVNGSAKYGIDTFIPGMVFGVIKHCPTFGGVLALTPSKPAAAIAVVPCRASDNRGAVLKDTYNAVAVVADNTWKAKNLAKSLSVSWKLPASTANIDSASLQLQAQQLLASGQPLIAETSVATTDPLTAETAITTALKGSSPVVEATFSLPYVAHATMESLNCSANITFSSTGTPVSCEVWAPNQAALSVVKTVTAITGITDTTKITVHTTFLGGGLGRKIEQDYISQTIQVAMAVKRPVKLTWMREEDLAHDQYRPMALIKAKAGLDANKKIAAWFYRTVTPSISDQRGSLKAGAVDSQAVECARNLHYYRTAHLCEWVILPAGIPVGYWRSVGASINAFAVERLMDKLAKAAGADPFDFRLNNVSDARAQAVLAKAESLSQWRKTLPATRAWGVAMAEAFGTIVCEVVEVSQPALGSLTVHRVLCVVDCGTVINPDSVQAQMEGSIVHGLSAALWGQVTFTKGVANQTNFNKYRVLRLNEMPAITVSIIPSTNPPSGIGEPGVPPIAPAVANAYSRLTGAQYDSLPLFPGATMSGI